MAGDSNIEVVLTDESELHCFKVIFHAAPEPGAELVPLEVLLHTTQAIDLFSQLAAQLSNYMYRASAELLAIRRRAAANQEQPENPSVNIAFLPEKS